MLPTPQQQADQLFEFLGRNLISRPEYVRQVDDLLSHVPKNLRPNIDRRRDKRSLGEFALHVYDTTLREKFLVEEWSKLFPDHDVVLEDNGVANDGRLVLDTQGNGGRLDFILNVDDVGRPLEVKFGPTQRFCTFKFDDLVNYARRPEMWLLVVLGDASMIGPNGNADQETALKVPKGLGWLLVDESSLGRVLALGQHGCHRGFGGKETVRLLARDFAAAAGGLRNWRPQPFPFRETVSNI